MFPSVAPSLRVNHLAESPPPLRVNFTPSASPVGPAAATSRTSREPAAAHHSTTSPHCHQLPITLSSSPSTPVQPVATSHSSTTGCTTTHGAAVLATSHSTTSFSSATSHTASARLAMLYLLHNFQTTPNVGVFCAAGLVAVFIKVFCVDAEVLDRARQEAFEASRAQSTERTTRWERASEIVKHCHIMQSLPVSCMCAVCYTLFSQHAGKQQTAPFKTGSSPRSSSDSDIAILIT